MKLLGRARLLVVAGLVNLLLIAALFWSRNGQTTTVTIQVVGDSYRTFIDGQLRAEARFTAGQRGGVLLAVEKNDSGVPTLPGPRGVDWVEVTDGHSGEVLFREDFDYFDGDIWRILSGEVAVHKGLVTAPVKTQIFLEDQGWNDFTLRVSYRNVASAQIGVKAKDSRNAVVYSFRPYRHYDNGLALLEDGVVVQSKPGSPIRAARAEVLKSITAMAVAPYPVIVVLVTAGILVTVVLQSLLQLLPLRSFLAALRRRRFSANSIALGIALAIAIDVFGLALYLNGTYNSFQPHVPDEVSYIFQARLFASGHLTAQPPPVKDAFDFFYPPLMYTGEHTWASVYPFGHPAALALGSIFGLMWLVPAVMGAGTAIFLYLVGRRLYGNATGVVAIVLLASSPFFLMTASNFMSHNTAAFYLTAALFFVVNRDRPRLYGALAGLFYGLLINTRTLTAVGLMIPLGIVFLGRLLPPRTRITAAKHFAAFAVFACVMAGAYLWYNYAITGDPLKSPYEAVGNLSEWFGFSGRHTLASGLQNEQVQMATLLVVFNGWPR